MVLHLRKLTAAGLALIMMMSATPAFALDNVTTAETESKAETATTAETVMTTETATTAETAATQPAVETEESVAEEIKPAEEQKRTCFVFLTFINQDGSKILDEEKTEIEDGTYAGEFIDNLIKENRLEVKWDELSFELNDKQIGPEDGDMDTEEFRNQVLENGDRLSVSVKKETEEEQSVQSENDVISVQADESETTAAHNSVINRSQNIMGGKNYAYGNEWGLIGVSRSINISEKNAESYCTSLATKIAEVRSDKLSNNPSDNSRTVIALTALGYDPTDVNGYNLLLPLADFNYVSKLNVSGPAWALIAFDSHNYDIPKATEGTQTTRELLIDKLLKSKTGAGWAFSGTNPDVDMTAMAIQALSPYYKKREDVAKAVNEAVAWLSKAQQQNGSYKSYGNESSESASQVIVALCSIGINPNTDERFVKNGNSVIDSLLKFRSSDGGFMHILTDKKYNMLATYQGCYALTAYQRMLTHKTSLFDMSDTELARFTAKPSDNPRTEPTENPEKKPDPAAGKVETAAKSLSGKTFSLGGKTISLNGKLTADDQTPADEKGIAGESADNKVYNSEAEKKALASALPWIYMAIGALALMGIVLILRNRKTEA